MPYFDNHFTVEEANASLPRIRAIFQRIHDLIQSSTIKSHRYNMSLHPLPPRGTNGKTATSSSPKKDPRKEIAELLSEISDQGIVIQDISRGLIDFPAWIQGEEVFLCYELADGDTIRYYHPLDTGFGGRKPLPE